MTKSNAILLRNGTVLQHQDGDHVVPLHATDVLIEGNKIAKIGKSLELDPSTEIIDCTDKIISPGMIDTHTHLWMTQMKARHAEHTLLEYVCSGGVQSFNLDPEDIYWGQLGGCLESLDAGTTTVVDHAHMTQSSAHVDEAIAATVHSGLRAFYCYVPIVRYKSWSPLIPNPDLVPSWALEQLQGLAKTQPFGNGRVSMGFGFDMWFLPKEKVVGMWEQARSWGVKLFTTHYCKNRIFGLRSIPELLKEYGLLKHDVIIAHGTQASKEDGKIISEAGAYVAAAPELEIQMACGQPLAFRDDMPCTLGSDGHFVGPADIMSQMRLALQLARHTRNQKILDENKFPAANIGQSEQAFNMGTIIGARAVGMEEQIGSIAEGKLADLVIFDATSPSMLCAAQHDPVTAIVRHSTIRDVNTVVVDGVVRKRNGVMLPVKVNGEETISKTISENKELSWEEIAKELIASRGRYATKLSTIDIPAGAEQFKKLAQLDDTCLVQHT